MEIKLKGDILKEMFAKYKAFSFSPHDQKAFDDKRSAFVAMFDSSRIQELKKEDYFAGLGKKEGCLSYELEWSTIELGSIKGGSKYKFGYEDDLPKIKKLLLDILDFQDTVGSFYESDGSLNKKSKELCRKSTEIKGLKTGRTVTGKLLSLYYPKTVISVFTDQDYLLAQLLNDYVPDAFGLELFLVNNFSLLTIKNEFLKVLGEAEKSALTNDKFLRFLYFCFPKEKVQVQPTDTEQESVQTLEYQHLQTLIHRNFQKLFADELVYFEPESQNERNGQYDTEEVGIIDFLCLDKKKDFVVIELKRKASDTTVGQLCRYIGWVKENLCKDKQSARGLIVAENKDIYLTFAIKAVPNIEFRKVEMSINISKDNE